ncbi:MAG: ATP-binding protein, partial [Treponema sp.]|nr:ATP-binding protein [Treponema sp.]
MMEKTPMYQVDINDVVRSYDFGDEDGFLFCLFEAVSNALYCCVNNQDIKITVQFKREYRANELIKDDGNFITAVNVTDNGTGFTDGNFAKFTKTIYKTNHEGGKGLGRVAFLKVFNDVSVVSCFEENGVYYSRNFKFNADTIKDTKKETALKKNPETTIYLKNTKSDFRDNAKKPTEYYSDGILNHFYIFLYFL